MIQLSIFESKVMFYSLLVLGPFILQISKYARNKLSKHFFIILSFIILVLPLGFRACGIDHETYILWFKYPELTTFPYRGSPEPLYELLILFSHYIVKSYWPMYFIPGCLFIGGTLYFISKKCLDYYIALSYIYMTLYIYMCGITRFSAAAGLLCIAFTDFNKTKRYFILVILATMSHYTAIVGVLIYFTYKAKSSITFRNIIIISIGFYIFGLVFSRYGSGLPLGIYRLASYVHLSLNFGAIKNVVLAIPAIIFLFFNYDELVNIDYEIKNVKKIILLMIIFIFASFLMEGVFRLCWYFYIFVAYIYALILPLKFGPNLHYFGSITILKCILVIIGMAYINMVFFDSLYVTQYILPFSFIF